MESIDKDTSEAPRADDTAAPEATTTEPVTKPAGGDGQASLVVHHLDNSRSQRILWLLEELEVPYSIRKHTRTEEKRAPESLKAVHSLGKAPVITDGDVTIAESGAIVEYIISKYGKNFHATKDTKTDDLFFSHYAEGSLMPILVIKFIFSYVPQYSPFFVRPLLRPIFAALEKRLVEPELKNHCTLIESYLEKSETGWLARCDHPTSADFMMMFPAEVLVSSSKFAGPKLKEYVDRVHKRPAYKRGIEKGGKYDYAKL